MTPNPITQEMSEAEVLAVLRDIPDSNEHYELGAGGRLITWTEKLDTARSTIESKFAELAQAKASRDAFTMAFDSLLAEHRELRSKYRQIESDRTALRDQLRLSAEQFHALEDERNALLEMVQRLLPWAHRDEARDAEALLSRIDGACGVGETK